MPRKRAGRSLMKKIDRNVPKNPLMQPPGSVWTQKGRNGELQLWGAHVDNSMQRELGSFQSAGVIVHIWSVPRGDRTGDYVVVTSPWNHMPLRVYTTMEKAIDQETIRWKVAKDIEL